MPQETIYLDDARIGRFRPNARKLHQRFLELVADAPSSRDVWNFLIHGVECLASRNASYKCTMKPWRGVDHFREAIAKSIADADVAPRDIYFAGRSRSLMSLGASMLSRRCSSVLAVDSNWPVYQHELSEIAKRVGCKLSVAQVQKHLISERWDVDDVVECLSQLYEHGKCDGLFLPAVDSMGIRLPITEIVGRLRSKHEVRFVLVDAAQALGHTDLSEFARISDFIVAGMHKWVGSYIPLGVGIASNPSSQQWIANFLKAAIGINGAGDSLSHMLHAVDNRCDSRFPETVNLGGLIAGFGAWTSTPSPRSALAMRIANADRVAAIAEFNGWHPIRPAEAMRSGSLILQTCCLQTRNRSLDEIRNSFADSGIILSTYENGVIRMAMPETLIPTERVLRIQDALFNANNSRRIAC